MKSQKKKLNPTSRKTDPNTESSSSDDSETSCPEDEDYHHEDETSADDDDDDPDEEDLITSDDNEDYFTEDFDVNFLAEAVKVLENHADVSMDNSIVLNRKLQETMEELRTRVLAMLNKCREIYEENQQKLANPSKMQSYLKGIGSCGRPFFKDKSGRHCPPNADYVRRSEVEKEFFPSDLELYPHFTWTAKDKVGIIQGIKEQAIEYVERKDSYKKKLSKTTALSKNVKLHSLKLKKLLEKVDADFEIDWNQISVHNLGSRHTANSCLASWNAYLRPEINRKEWTDEENIKLNELAKKYHFQDWVAIAAEMPFRSDYQCFVQYQTVVSIKMREDKGERWTKEEDDLLLSLVEKYSMGNVIRWNPICSQLPNRSKKQCFARWKYSINPNISRALFTPEEDCIILAAVEEFGENFNCFPKDLFPNRTVVQIRNRYNNSIKTRGLTKHWTPQDDQLLLDLIDKYGQHDWTKIAASIQSHTRTSCRTRYLTIAKFLKENPDATVEDIPRKKRRARSNVTKNNWVETITNLKNGQDSPASSSSLMMKEPNENPTLYRSKLRHNEFEWYNFLKYSYDFKFGQGYTKVPKCLASLEFVRYVFECQLNWPVVLHGGYAKSFVAVSLEKLIRLHEQDEKTLVFERPDVGFKLPPSYCSLLAFRGLCITASFGDGQDKVATAVAKFPPDAIEARHKFQQRLRSLLYNTTLLSRLEPQTSVEQNKFEVIFDANTTLGQVAAINLAELKVAQTNKMAENLRIAQEKADRNRQYKAKMKRQGKANPNDNAGPPKCYRNRTRVNKETVEKPKKIEGKAEIRKKPTEDIKRLNGSRDELQLELANEEPSPVYETLMVMEPTIETKPIVQFESYVTENVSRKRTFEESMITFEESSQSQSYDSHIETKYIKREKE